MPQYVIWLIVIVVFVFFGATLAILSRYRKCPSDKILVIYGKVGRGSDGTTRSAKCLHGGAAFIWPVVQSYQYLDLTPISINVDLRSALSRQNIRIDVPSRFTVGISTEPGIIQNAAERLLGLNLGEVQALAQDILFGQLRLVIATMDIEEINTNRDKFLEAVAINVEVELKKIGLRLINVNVTDISDESGYIEALGKEAAAQAINDAKKSVAEKNRDGTIGEANAMRDQRVAVSLANAEAVKGENDAMRDQRIAVSLANAEAVKGENNAMRDQRIAVSLADSEAVKGENTARIEIADSDAIRREREAEATRRATAAEKVQAAKALEEAYAAEQTAEHARAEREQATFQADVIVKAEVEKQTVEIAAEAEAEKLRRHAKGQADAIFAKMEAQGRGTEEILTRQAVGLSKIVGAAGGDLDGAVRMMITDKLEELVKLQVAAISNLKIDKVTVWDGGAGGADGKTSTANFLSGLLQSLPPLNDVYKMAGLDLPNLVSVEAEAPPEEPKPMAAKKPPKK